MADVHHFSTEDAKRYGVDAAVLLYNIRFWLEKNKANRRNIHDGRVWTYNTQDAWCELFPYYTKRQIQRIIKKLSDEGLLLKDNHNKNRFDKTVWYSLDLAEFRLEAPELPITPNGAIDKTERCHPSHETVLSLTDNKQQIENSKSVSSTREFDFFSKVMTELQVSGLPEHKVTYARLKIEEFQDRFPTSQSVADCWAYVNQAIEHQYSLTGQ